MYSAESGHTKDGDEASSKKTVVGVWDAEIKKTADDRELAEEAKTEDVVVEETPQDETQTEVEDQNLDQSNGQQE